MDIKCFEGKTKVMGSSGSRNWDLKKMDWKRNLQKESWKERVVVAALKLNPS
jgi:hypothetical protein